MKKTNEMEKQMKVNEMEMENTVETIEKLGSFLDADVLYQKCDDEYVITYMGLVIRHCPSNVDNFKFIRISDAINCYLDCMYAYYTVYMNYNNIKDDIKNIYLSLND